MRFRSPVLFATPLVLVLATLSAQDAPAGAARKPVIVVLGASLSAGFVDPRPRPDGERNESIKLKTVLSALWPRGAAKIRDLSDLSTFRDPAGIQGKKVSRALNYEPDLVVAIDFAFWFGYGYTFGKPEVVAKRRLEAQKQVFALIEQFDCPVILGDYPDMHGADPKMLGRAMIPAVKTLAELNRRLREFIAEHENVHLFPLHDYTAQIKSKGLTIECDGTVFVVPPMALLQADRLHPTRLGVALVVRRLAQGLLAVLPQAHPLRPAGEQGDPVELLPLVDKARADAELDLYAPVKK